MVAASLLHNQLLGLDRQSVCLPHSSVPQGGGLCHLVRAPSGLLCVDIQPTSQIPGDGKHPCDIESKAN